MAYDIMILIFNIVFECYYHEKITFTNVRISNFESFQSLYRSNLKERTEKFVRKKKWKIITQHTHTNIYK